MKKKAESGDPGSDGEQTAPDVKAEAKPERVLVGQAAGFERGGVSFSILSDVGPCPGTLTPEAVALKLAGHESKDAASISAGAVDAGWVGYRHLFDVPMTPANTLIGRSVRATLLHSERKIPSSLLRAEVGRQEVLRLEQTGQTKLSKRDRAEIRADVVKLLLPTMPPTLRTCPVLVPPWGDCGRLRIVLAGATSTSAVDALAFEWKRATGHGLMPLDVGMLATLAGAKVEEWPAVSFSPDVASSDLAHDDAGDFLTWLWFWAEREGENGIPLRAESRTPNTERPTSNAEGRKDLATFHVDGPLLLRTDESETAVRRGNVMASAETRTALLSGKKLHRCKLSVCVGNDVYACMFDAASFTFRGLKLPIGARRGSADVDLMAFQWRVDHLERFVAAMLAAVGEFRAQRDAPGPQGWQKVVAAMRAWVKDRKTRKG